MDLNYEAIWALSVEIGIKRADLMDGDGRMAKAFALEEFLRRVLPVNGDWLSAAYSLGVPHEKILSASRNNSI